MAEYPSELRRGSLNNRWTLIAAGRANRPYDWHVAPPPAKRADPFTPENIRPVDVTDRIRNVDGTKYSVESDWKALAIVNAYPFVKAFKDGKPRLKGSVVDGHGYHEIIIHSPDVGKDFATFEPEQTQAVLELYLKRYNRLSHQPDVQHVQIFTNRGSEAGASIAHPHSQVVALPIVPPYIRELVRAAREHHEAVNRKVSEDEVQKEIHDSERIIYENSQFLVYCPFAPHADYHIRIIPKQPGSHFHEISQEQLEHLSRVLNLAFRRLDRIAGLPPYNAFIRTAPIHAKPAQLKGFRWHIDIIPHLSTPGGLEISTDLNVVTVFPEEAAHALRQDS